MPIQLMLLNFKRNRLLLAIWIMLFAIITENFAKNYGVPYLFLDPEYMSKVNFWSLFILGFSFGIFTIAYNITIYILESDRFQFLMFQKDPFAKFCLNQSFFPALFLVVYCYKFIYFQIEQGQQNHFEIFKEIMGFLTGYHLTLMLTFLYFKITEYQIFKYFTQTLSDNLRLRRITRAKAIQKIKMIKRKSYYVEHYLDFPIQIKRVDEFLPYEKQIVTKIIDRNHINAFLLQVTGFVLLLVLGYFRDNPWFQIPAGASILILTSIIAMFLGAFAYWFKGWTLLAILALLVLWNFGAQIRLFNPDYEAFGLNYDAAPTNYTHSTIEYFASDSLYHADTAYTLRILENWRKKFGNQSKPKLLLICTSGGGQRAAVWTMRSLQICDSVLGGDLMKYAICISGASGGLIGASYYRELYLQKLNGIIFDHMAEQYVDNISKDILNPVVFSLVINDIFLRFEKFTDGKYTYTKDRGYAFENQLNINTGGVLRKKIKSYSQDEFSARIPLLLLTPSIVNDGRKLYLSSQPCAYMSSTEPGFKSELKPKVKGIEFMRFFKDQDAANLDFISALRMSATFPYITPNINLPSKPGMEIMDAGISDNYGIVEAVRFAFTFRNWINLHTSGVVFLCIRDSPKIVPVERRKKSTVVERLFNPIGTLYANWDWIQDNNNEYYLEYASEFLNNMHVVEFQYSPQPKLKSNKILSQEQSDALMLQSWKERASLSWHLTKFEKMSLKNTVYEYRNKQSIEKLSRIFKADSISK